MERGKTVARKIGGERGQMHIMKHLCANMLHSTGNGMGKLLGATIREECQ